MLAVETTGATNYSKDVEISVQFGNNINCIDGIIYMREAPEPIIRETQRGNKFDRTKEWEDRHDYVIDGEYMGNCNTGIYHSLGCSDISAMNKEHKVPTDNDKGLYRGCGHCRPGTSKFQNTLDSYKISKDEPSDIEFCRDPKIERIFAGVACDCGSKDGILKMRPHDGGVRLLNRDGKWWIYRECYSCGYQLSLDKAFARRKLDG